MSRIEEMIREMCPEGVKRVKLEDLAVSICTGLNPRTNFKLNTEGAENYYVTVKEINTNKIVFSSNTDRISDDAWEIIERRSRLEKGDVLFSGIGTIGKVAYVDIEVNNWNCSESVFLIKPKQCINGKFLTYILRSDVAKNQYEPHSSGSIMKGVRKETLKSLQIPLPPLPIQEKIVEILEKFSLLSAELEAELEGRRKQYDFYRNRLLSFDSGSDSVMWKTLGEVACYAKSRISLDEVDEDNYVGVENLLQNKLGKTISTCVPTSGNCIEYIVGDILIGNIRPYLKKIWLADRRGGTNGDVLTIRILPEYSGQILPRYLFHLLSSEEFFNYDNQYAKGAKMPRGDKNAVLKYSIPVPSLAEQERIVRILDKFEALVTDLSAGLPAEIERVQKQYEYYRNKLLTFPEA